ncbi:hypothetical protein NE237_000580 [Protea cynaroides]|uniref:Uncharacterized protein n=1 Tax=Protea cynaroides TaxID=273540 RepID=A0A9Q0KSH5_9MAGN|nr:hypothetical protein NE237_000580 [Protea cynaroides]
MKYCKNLFVLKFREWFFQSVPQRWTPLASPRSMFVSQVIGTAMGCVISPCVFWVFYNAFTDMDQPGTAYPAPYALVYRSKPMLGKKWAKYIPLPMAMTIPFYIGFYFAIDMCVGSLILFVWQKLNRAKADAFGPAVASGLICGDGIWTLPSSILALAKVTPPICMKFLSSSDNARVDAFLGS